MGNSARTGPPPENRKRRPAGTEAAQIGKAALNSKRYSITIPAESSPTIKRRPVTMPPEILTDEEWFAANPDRRHRMRPVWPTDIPFALVPDRYKAGIWVVVRLTDTGYEFLAYVAKPPFPDSEWLAGDLFNTAAKKAARIAKGEIDDWIS